MSRALTRPATLLSVLALGVSAVAVVVVLADPASPAQAKAPVAVKAIGVLTVDGIKGESTAKRYAGSINVLSFSDAVSTSATPGGGSQGKPVASPLTLRVPVDKAYPLLLKNAAKGTHIKKVVLTACHGADACASNPRYLVITLESVLVSSVKVHNPPAFGGVATVDLAFTFDKATWAYYPQKADGSLGAPVKVTWDVKLNKVT